MILPIFFKTIYKKTDLNNVSSAEILEMLEQYLEHKGFLYINRKSNKIVFHKLTFFRSMKMRDFLVSGEIKIKEKQEDIIIINGNWMVFIIALFFLAILFLAQSQFSTFDLSDVKIMWYFFSGLFGLNLVIRFFSHLEFKNKIRELIKTHLLDDE